jgi:hypothetical protein
VQLWAGNPAKFVRMLNKHELNHMQQDGEETALIAELHAAQFSPEPTGFRKVCRGCRVQPCALAAGSPSSPFVCVRACVLQAESLGLLDSDKAKTA